MLKTLTTKYHARLVSAAILKLGGQKFLAAKFGVGQATVSRWENEESRVPTVTVLALEREVRFA